MQKFLKYVPQDLVGGDLAGDFSQEIAAKWQSHHLQPI